MRTHTNEAFGVMGWQTRSFSIKEQSLHHPIQANDLSIRGLRLLSCRERRQTHSPKRLPASTDNRPSVGLAVFLKCTHKNLLPIIHDQHWLAHTLETQYFSMWQALQRIRPTKLFSMRDEQVRKALKNQQQNGLLCGVSRWSLRSGRSLRLLLLFVHRLEVDLA